MWQGRKEYRSSRCALAATLKYCEVCSAALAQRRMKQNVSCAELVGNYLERPVHFFLSQKIQPIRFN
jgi:hypothetical protein